MARIIIRFPEVKRRTGKSATQVWRDEKGGTFPVRVQLGPNAVGWYEDEIDAWIEARPRGGGRRPQCGGGRGAGAAEVQTAA